MKLEIIGEVGAPCGIIFNTQHILTKSFDISIEKLKGLFQNIPKTLP